MDVGGLKSSSSCGQNDFRLESEVSEDWRVNDMDYL